ncbi:39S ribosomal protein L40, mitochondrial [Pseudolycoriella hygida]|uniref:Large ribosomal subunit protein mL40 n=1 Tax=Pseudolycoriella hygida TaxID=35572 RepID=A0A9Q0MVW8_9DIPT|nr:39S ribosomal protein L40, mitochondrial [Pseudolycoriella hygida]
MSIIASAFSRLSLHQTFHRSFTTSSVVALSVTPILCGEPLKKKKKIDPAIIKQREDRKRKKLEKQIRRLEKNARQLKPIDEMEVPLSLIDEKDKRTRPLPKLTAEVVERRALLEKSWARYQLQEKLRDYKIIDRVQRAQQKALQELRFESKELYDQAIQIDPNLVPIHVDGPTATPAIDNYESPDGEYVNISKKWD